MRLLKIIFLTAGAVGILAVFTLITLTALETKNFKFKNQQQYLIAQKNKKLGFGFLPTTLPVCAQDIHATYNIDTNNIKFDFICEDEENFQSWLKTENDFLKEFLGNSDGKLKTFISKKQLDP